MAALKRNPGKKFVNTAHSGYISIFAVRQANVPFGGRPPTQDNTLWAQYFGTDVIRVGKANEGAMDGGNPGLGASGAWRCRGLSSAVTPPNLSVIGKDTRLSGYMLEPRSTGRFHLDGMDVFLLARCRQR
ncbi:hypothetical protein LAD64_24320 [Klebsiella pneumoniae]|nr:hypothetical protein [Klebsiella pneumoniae]